MPKVSIIIPAYNAESTIKCTIESVQKQTYRDYELIIIDDGSSDRTAKIVREIADNRLKLFNYKNRGLSTSRNRGIQQATGEYIAFLDADDLWTKDKLEKQIAILETNPEVGVVYSQTYYIDSQSSFLYYCDPVSFTGNVLPELLLTNFLHNGSNPLIRKQAVATVGEFDSSLNSSEDWDYYLRLAALYSFAVVPEYQVLYRRSGNNMSSNVAKMKQASYTVLERAYQKFPQFKHYRGQSLSILHLYCAELYLRNSKFKAQNLSRAGADILLSIRFYPQNLFNRNTQRMLVKLLLAILPLDLLCWLKKFKKTLLKSRFQSD